MTRVMTASLKMTMVIMYAGVAAILQDRMRAVPAAGLSEYFRHHLEYKLHFIALGKEGKDNGILVNLLATSEEIARRVLTAFNWQQTGDLIY
jgi:hypothetical protein